MSVNSLAGAASVLVVDDNRAMSKMLKYNLEGPDTEVIEADQSLDNMSVLSKRVDVILVGLRLPFPSEWSILSQLRSIENLRDTPIIVISPEAPLNSLMRKFQPDEFIRAPFDIRDLLLRVRTQIRRTRAGLLARAEEAVN